MGATIVPKPVVIPQTPAPVRKPLLPSERPHPFSSK
jgi:hypothetical protein